VSGAAAFSLAAAILLAGMAVVKEMVSANSGAAGPLVPGAALCVWGAVQVCSGRSVSPSETAGAALLLAAFLVVLVSWACLGSGSGTARRLAGAVLATCLAQAVFAAVQWSRDPTRLYDHTSELVTTPFGSYVNHNHFAGLMEMGALLAAGMACGSLRQKGLRAGSVVLAGLALGLLVAHLASRSRGGLVALLGGSLCLIVAWLCSSGGRRHRVGRRLLAALLGAGVVVGLGLSVVPQGTRQHLGTTLRGLETSSGTYRLDVARWTLQLALSQPISGSGLGAFSDALPPFKRGYGGVRVVHAENDVLEFAAEGGLVGLALMGWLAVLLCRRVVGGLRHEPDGVLWGIRLGAVGAVGALLTHSLLDFNLRIPANALVFCSLLGLACAGREPGSVRRPWLRWPTMALLALLAVVAGWRAWGAWELERALRDSSPEARVAALGRTLSWHPYLADGWRARGLAWRDLARRVGGFEGRRLERARRDLERAVALRPQWAEVWADLGWTHYLAGDATAAERALDRARDLDPTHLSIGAARGQFYATAGREEAAIEEIRRLREMNPQWPVQAARAMARRWTEDPELLARVAE
jgi:O-antigen ligase